MEYRNVKTGAVIDIQSELISPDWEPVKAKAKAVKTAPKTSKKGKAGK